MKLKNWGTVIALEKTRSLDGWVGGHKSRVKDCLHHTNFFNVNLWNGHLQKNRLNQNDTLAYQLNGLASKFKFRDPVFKSQLCSLRIWKYKCGIIVANNSSPSNWGYCCIKDYWSTQNAALSSWRSRRHCPTLVTIGIAKNKQDQYRPVLRLL